MKILKLIAVLLILVLRASADYNDITLKEFANIVATQNKINIVIDEDLDKTFNFIISKPIKDYTNLDVFTELLDKQGFQLQYRGSYYMILKKADRLVDKMYIFKTNNIDAKKAAKRIKPIISSFYKQQQLNKHTSKQPNQQTTSVPISHDQNKTVLKKNFTISALDHNHLVLTYKDKKIKRYTQMLISSMDNIKQQLAIQCQVYEIKTSALEEKGIQLEALGERVGKTINIGLNIAGSAQAILSSPTNRLRLDSLFSLLHDSKDSTLIGTPKITLLEGSSGTVKDGQTYPTVNTSTTTTNASTSQTSSTTKYIDIGITLSVDYQYMQDKNNYLKLALTKKDLLNYDPNAQSIITTNRDISTDIRIKEGETIILAGVSSDTMEKKTVKVPYFSQIPLLGELLKYKYSNKKKTTLVITIQVHYTNTTKSNLVKDLYAHPGTNKKSISLKTR